MSFSSGIHYWEIICPITCQSIRKLAPHFLSRSLAKFFPFLSLFITFFTFLSLEFGITSDPLNISDANSVAETFIATTKRTLVVQLDLNCHRLFYWLNGSQLKRNRVKHLSKHVNKTWTPFVRFLLPNLAVTLNPYCPVPFAPTCSQKHKSKLPSKYYQK